MPSLQSGYTLSSTPSLANMLLWDSARGQSPAPPTLVPAPTGGCRFSLEAPDCSCPYCILQAQQERVWVPLPGGG